MQSDGRQSVLAAVMTDLAVNISLLTGSYNEALNLTLSQAKMFNKSRALKDHYKTIEAQYSQIDNLGKRIDSVVKALNVLIKSRRYR